jgi:hypothetical protein
MAEFLTTTPLQHSEAYQCKQWQKAKLLGYSNRDIEDYEKKAGRGGRVT